MYKWFKKYFIPHEFNEYKPHLFKEVSVFFLFVTVALLFLLAVSGPTILIRTNFTALVLPKVLVDYANEDRATKSYSQLAINPVLEKAAQMKADDMASKGYFAHKSPEGKTPWHWFREAGYDFSYAGENLAVNFSDSAQVNNAWMNSPLHRDNIMNSNFTEVGIATAEGYYNGRTTIFVVQLFGRPAKKQVATVPTTVTSTEKIIPIATTTPELKLATIASSSVLGVSGENDLYIAVENVGSVATGTATETYSSFIDKVLLSPEKTLSIVYTIIALLISIGLLAMIFMEAEKRHPPYIIIAVLILILIFFLHYLYNSIILAPLLIA